MTQEKQEKIAEWTGQVHKGLCALGYSRELMGLKRGLIAPAGAYLVEFYDVTGGILDKHLV